MSNIKMNEGIKGKFTRVVDVKVKIKPIFNPGPDPSTEHRYTGCVTSTDLKWLAKSHMFNYRVLNVIHNGEQSFRSVISMQKPKEVGRYSIINVIGKPINRFEYERSFAENLKDYTKAQDVAY